MLSDVKNYALFSRYLSTFGSECVGKVRKLVNIKENVMPNFLISLIAFLILSIVQLSINLIVTGLVKKF